MDKKDGVLLYNFISWLIYVGGGSDGAEVRVLTSHQCGLGLIPRVNSGNYLNFDKTRLFHEYTI